MNADDKPRRHQDSAFRPIAGEGGLVVLPGRAEIKVLNPVAIKVFSLLDGSRSLNEIAEAVSDEFDVSRDQALLDIAAFVGQLAEHGMLAEPASQENPT